MAKLHSRQNHILLFSIIFKMLEVIKIWIESVGGESVSVLKFEGQETAVSGSVSAGSCNLAVVIPEKEAWTQTQARDTSFYEPRWAG